MQKKKLTPLQIVGHVLHTAILGVLAVVMAVLLFAANVILPGYARMVNAMLGYKKSWDNSKVQTDGLNLDYNTSDYTADNIGAAEADLTDRINSEGVVLLKNDGGLPLAEGTTVSLFSANSNQNAGAGLMGGGTPLNTALASHGLNVNETLWNFYSAGAGAGYGLASGSISFGDAEDFRINECPLSVLQGESGLLDSVQGTTPVYVLKRVAGEGRDMPRSMYNHADTQEDKVRSYLEPDTTEREILQYLNDNYDNTVLIINSNAALELDWLADYPNIKSVLYAPTIGASMADILTGKVSPSGRTVDTFAADASASPAAQNFGDYAYYDENGNITKYNYVTYEEGIYVGYRYYETRYEDTVLGQGNAGDYDYAKEVIYPFGYGLSYTTFTQKMSDITSDGSSLKFSVTVTNTGSAAGKDVVEIYNDPPYTNGGIEKASANLLDFAKTSELAPGESETIDFTIPVEDLASYDYKNNGCYVLEAGDYIISTNSDSHNVLDSKTYTVASDIVYNESNKRESDEVVAINQFDFAEGEITYLSRADGFANYDEAIAAPATYEMSDEVKAGFENCFTYTESGYEKDEDPNAEDITTGAKNGLKLADLRGVDYNDSKWDDLLDEMSIDDLQQTIGFGGYQTAAVDSIGKVRTNDCDGPASINNNFTGVGSVGFPAATLIGMTWSKDLAHDFGDSIGKMANEMNTSGWYGPAMNIHRTAFSGRNFEYYSEDGVLSGAMAANAIAGAQEHGVYAYMKHFALNDQEGNRNCMAATWSNEQAIREIYLKPFEMSVKDADCHAVMSSFNYIGNRWAGGCSELLQNVLRGEWGFLGFVETDYFGVYGYMTADQAVRNGGDLMLCTTGNDYNNVTVLTNSSKQAMRTSAKNILYTVVNSRAYEAENLNPGMAKWKVIMIGADVVVALLIVGLEYTAIKNYKKRKEEEEEV